MFLNQLCQGKDELLADMKLAQGIPIFQVKLRITSVRFILKSWTWQLAAYKQGLVSEHTK